MSKKKDVANRDRRASKIMKEREKYVRVFRESVRLHVLNMGLLCVIM